MTIVLVVWFARTVILRSGAVNSKVGSVRDNNLVFSNASFELDTGSRYQSDQQVVLFRLDYCKEDL